MDNVQKSPLLPPTLRAILRSAQVLRRRRSSLLVLAVLGLGIGACLTVFSLVDAVLFKGLPVSRSEEVVLLFGAQSAQGEDPGKISLPFASDYAGATSVRSMEFFADRLPVDVQLDPLSPQRLTASVVGPAYFATLEVSAFAGRLLDRTPETRTGVVVVSHRLLARAREQGAEPLGATIRINRHPFLVIGVADRGFHGLSLDHPVDLWIPMADGAVAAPAWDGQLDYRSSAFFQAVGRLAPGTSLQSAQAELTVMAAAVGAGRAATAGPEADDPDWREPWPWLREANQVAGAAARPMARLLVGVAGLILVLTFADVSGLLLSEAQRRCQETAVRMAIGGSLVRIVRDVVVEAGLLAVAGGVVALALCHVITGAVAAILEPALWAPVTALPGALSPRVLVLAFALGILTTTVTSLSLVWYVTRVDVSSALRKAALGTPRGTSFRTSLVVAQVAIITILFLGFGTLLRVLWHGAAVDPGVDVRRVVIADIDPARAGYNKGKAVTLVEGLEAELTRAPHATAAAVSVGAPLQGGPATSVTIEGISIRTDFVMITPDYFRVLGIPLLRGRAISRQDGRGAPHVVVVNQAFAHRHLGRTEPLGRHLANFTPQLAELEIVGLVQDVRTRGLREAPQPTIYVPLLQFYDAFPWSFPITAVISAPNPALGHDALRHAAREVDPLLPLLKARPLSEALGEAYARQRTLATLLLLLAVLGSVLAASGVYGVVALATEARMREFAVRIALGVQPISLQLAVLRHSFALGTVGLFLGLLAAVPARRLIEPFMDGTLAWDPLLWSALCSTVLALCLLAAISPARRASSADPARILRQP